MMGVCFECLLEIDGVANRQGCMVQAADGMRVSRMRGARGLADSNGPPR
jgi:predicted molibdopterin-dependent oxidoreductase YjgC